MGLVVLVDSHTVDPMIGVTVLAGPGQPLRPSQRALKHGPHTIEECLLLRVFRREGVRRPKVRVVPEQENPASNVPRLAGQFVLRLPAVVVGLNHVCEQAW